MAPEPSSIFTAEELPYLCQPPDVHRLTISVQEHHCGHLWLCLCSWVVGVGTDRAPLSSLKGCLLVSRKGCLLVARIGWVPCVAVDFVNEQQSVAARPPCLVIKRYGIQCQASR